MAIDLAQNRTGGMTDEQYDRFAGALMAVAVHMLQAGRDEEWTIVPGPQVPVQNGNRRQPVR